MSSVCLIVLRLVWLVVLTLQYQLIDRAVRHGRLQEASHATAASGTASDGISQLSSLFPPDLSFVHSVTTSVEQEDIPETRVTLVSIVPVTQISTTVL
jgi:hypothetical protein